MDEQLKTLVDRAKNVSMTQPEIDEQRINFAYGNAGEGDEGTKDSVKAAATIMKDTRKK